MKTFYVCGYMRNGDGILRKGGKRHVLSIAHTKEDAFSERLRIQKIHGTKYDYRIFDGRWQEVKEKQ